MPVEPAIAEELLALLDKHPDLTPVQRAILKSAAAYLVQDEDDRLYRDRKSEDYDPRIKMDSTEYFLVPDRIELIHGITRPKEWETPNRLAACQRERKELESIEAEGFTWPEVWAEWERRRAAGLL